VLLTTKQLLSSGKGTQVLCFTAKSQNCFLTSIEPFGIFIAEAMQLPFPKESCVLGYFYVHNSFGSSMYGYPTQLISCDLTRES